MKQWIALIAMVVLLYSAGFVNGMSVGRAKNNDILVKRSVEYKQKIVKLKTSYVESIVRRDKQSREFVEELKAQRAKYAKLRSLFKQFKDHPFYPYHEISREAVRPDTLGQ